MLICLKIFKARGGSPSDVDELLMTDERHPERPMVRQQSARRPKCCMKPLQSLFSLVFCPHNCPPRDSRDFTAQIFSLTEFRAKKRLLAVKVCLVFQRNSCNLPALAYVCFCFRQEVDPNKPRNHAKKALVPGPSGNTNLAYFTLVVIFSGRKFQNTPW